MKSLTELWKAAARDLAAICGTPIERDIETMLARVESEGISFLTITLPQFASDMETCLAAERVESNLFNGFKRRGGLPAFLSGFLSQIFDERDLRILENPNIDAIRSVRRLCLLFKKMEFDCTPERQRAAIRKYVDCEADLQKVLDNYENLPIDEFKRISSILFGDVFDSANRKVQNFELVPGHGPGSTADGIVGNQKFAQSEWTDRLEEYFPYGQYVLPHWKYFKNHSPAYLTPDQERPVEVILVPKTLKTPRVIAREPVCMQYMQQALMHEFVRGIEGNPLSAPFTHFLDQTLNQEAAREASLTCDSATLDLSEASDRVLNALVVDMLAPWPDLSGAVQACRSTTAILPNDTKVSLVKFASMGSALCFPMEAMVFTTILFMGIQAHTGNRLTVKELLSYRGRVHVYGDDMIVPSTSATEIIRLLEAFGLKVNHTKSFLDGKFRESCGGDYFNGRTVNPIRLKQAPPNNRRDTAEIANWTSVMNAFNQAGMARSYAFARETIELALGQRLVNVPRGSGAIGIEVDPILCVADRVNPNTHTGEVKSLRIVDVDRMVGVDDVWALQKTLSKSWSDPRFKDHLKYSGRPLSSRIKRAWVAISW